MNLYGSFLRRRARELPMDGERGEQGAEAKNATFLTYAHESKGLLDVVNVARRFFTLPRTLHAKRLRIMGHEGLRGYPGISMGISPKLSGISWGYPRVVSGINLGIPPQDVGIRSGISPRKSQDVGITFF
jgi:hypothetical protein